MMKMRINKNTISSYVTVVTTGRRGLVNIKIIIEKFAMQKNYSDFHFLQSPLCH